MKETYILIDKDIGEIYGQAHTKEQIDRLRNEQYSGRHIIGEDNPDYFIKTVKIKL